MSHQSAESRVSINRLRCRLRNHNPTIQATATTPSPAPTMTPVETQSLVAPDVHSFTAPSAAANTTIPIATLIPERAFYISLMNMIIGPVRVQPRAGEHALIRGPSHATTLRYRAGLSDQPQPEEPGNGLVKRREEVAS